MSDTQKSRSGAPSPEKKPEVSDHQVTPMPESHVASISVPASHIVRPFPPSFHDHDDASMPWYDCIEEDKLCVLGLFAILAYDDDDNGDLGVEHRLVYPTEWPLFELTPQRLEALRDDLIAAGILRLDIHNEDWHFQGVGGQSAQSLKAIVMDGLIRKKCAILVFDEAVSQLSTPIFSTFTYQTYLSLLQLTWAFSQIAQDQTKKHRVVEDLLKARLRFMALLRYIQKCMHPQDSRREVLEKKITDI